MSAIKAATKLIAEDRFYIVKNEKGTRDFFISRDWMTDRRLKKEYENRIIKMIELKADDKRTLSDMILEYGAMV